MSEEEVAKQIRHHNCLSGSCVHQSALTVVNGVMAGAVRISRNRFFQGSVRSVTCFLHTDRNDVGHD